MQSGLSNVQLEKVAICFLKLTVENKGKLGGAGTHLSVIRLTPKGRAKDLIEENM